MTIHSDDLAVDEFAAAMKAKLAKNRADGRSGWESCSEDELMEMLERHLQKPDPIDWANFAMMIWHVRKQQ